MNTCMYYKNTQNNEDSMYTSIKPSFCLFFLSSFSSWILLSNLAECFRGNSWILANNEYDAEIYMHVVNCINIVINELELWPGMNIQWRVGFQKTEKSEVMIKHPTCIIFLWIIQYFENGND